MSGQAWSVKTKYQAEQFNQYVLEELSAGRERTYSIQDTQRTNPQNSGLHGVLRRLSVALNDCGAEYQMKSPFKADYAIPWSETTVKEALFRPLIRAMYDKESSAQLTKKELSEAVDILLAKMAEIAAINISGLEGEV